MNAPSLKRDGKKSVKKELREPEETVQVCSVVILFLNCPFASLVTNVADPYFYLTDPDPTPDPVIFVIDLREAITF
jgi:hypothetical protein